MRYRHSIWVFVLAIAVFFAGALHAQPGSEWFVPSAKTSGLSPVAVLGNGWVNEDHKPVPVPYARADKKEMLVQRLFELKGFDKLPDTLYLYFEGIAWTSEIYLNKRLIGITEDPFVEHVFLLEKSLFLAAGNVLELRMSLDGIEKPFYPEKFLGIFRQVAVMRADPASAPSPGVKYIPSATNALMIAPWSLEQGCVHDSVAMGWMMEGLFSIPPGLPVTFAFRPSNKAMRMVAASKVQVVADWESVDSIGFFNAFPVSSSPKPLTTPFWRRTDSRPTGFYGKFYAKKEVSAPIVMPLDKLSLVIFLFLPVLLLLILKLLLPRVFDSMPEYISRGKIYMELIASNKFLKDEHRLFLNLIRVTILALTVSLFLYYLSVTGSWGRLNVLSSESLLHNLFAGSQSSLYIIFLKCWAFILSITVFKYFLLNFVMGIYRIHGFAAAIQSLDIFASFPLNVLPLIPAAVIFFMPAEQGVWALGIWYGLMGVYWGRRLYLVYTGLTRLFNLSLSLKILYICTLEISPWIFLL